MSTQVKAATAAVIALLAALTYDVMFAVAACYPSSVDPVGIAMSLPYAALRVGLGFFVAILVFAYCGPALAVAKYVLLAISRYGVPLAIVLAALMGYAMHPHGVPCAI